MSNPNKIILGLLGAAAVGVAIGILLAPETGGEVRKKIADKATDIASRIGELISSGKEKTEAAGDMIASKSMSFADNLGSRFEKTNSHES